MPPKAAIDDVHDHTSVAGKIVFDPPSMLSPPDAKDAPMACTLETGRRTFYRASRPGWPVPGVTSPRFAAQLEVLKDVDHRRESSSFARGVMKELQSIADAVHYLFSEPSTRRTVYSTYMSYQRNRRSSRSCDSLRSQTTLVQVDRASIQPRIHRLDSRPWISGQLESRRTQTNERAPK